MSDFSFALHELVLRTSAEYVAEISGLPLAVVRDWVNAHSVPYSWAAHVIHPLDLMHLPEGASVYYALFLCELRDPKTGRTPLDAF